MDLGLKGRTALVLGGSAGLGQGCAEALAAEGVKVALLSRDSAKLDAAAKRIEALGGAAVTIAADLAEETAPARALEAATAALGAIDILVANCGGPPPLPAVDFDRDLWRAQFQAMMLSNMELATSLLPSMRARGFGRILIISSTSVIEPIPGLVLSNAIRAGITSWAKTLAAEVARDGITVNTVMPGSIATDRTRGLDAMDAEDQNTTPEEIAKRAQAQIPAGRYGTAAEFGALAAFLASDRAAYITGTAIPVDGGLLKS